MHARLPFLPGDLDLADLNLSSLYPPACLQHVIQYKVPYIYTPRQHEQYQRPRSKRGPNLRTYIITLSPGGAERGEANTGNSCGVPEGTLRLRTSLYIRILRREEGVSWTLLAASFLEDVGLLEVYYGFDPRSRRGDVAYLTMVRFMCGY